MRTIALLLMLCSLSATAQKQKFDFIATANNEKKDTVHISTSVNALSFEWKDGAVDLYTYTNGVFPIGNADIICFDDYTVARYLIVYYTSDKRDKIDYAIL